MDAGNQFIEGEWFDQIVVKPSVQRLNTIFNPIAACEHQGGRSVALLAKAFVHINPGEIRQIPVDDQHIDPCFPYRLVLILPEKRQSLCTCAGGDHLESFCFKFQGQAVCQLLVVFEKQDVHTAYNFSWGQDIWLTVTRPVSSLSRSASEGGRVRHSAVGLRCERGSSLQVAVICWLLCLLYSPIAVGAFLY